MYIRRKVFSLLQDENGDERYFSTTDFEYEDELDDRFYSKKDEDEEEGEKKGLSKGAKIALGTGGALAATVGAYQGGRAIQRGKRSRIAKKIEKGEELSNKEKEMLNKSMYVNKIDRAGQAAEKGVKNAVMWVGNKGKDFGNFMKTSWNGGKEGKHPTLNKVAMIGIPVAATGAIAGGVALAKRNKKKKEDKEDK